MPLFSNTHTHRSSSPSLPTSYTSKPLKPQKPNSTLVPTNLPLPILVFSLLCFIFGLVGTILAVSALRRPIPVPVFRCGRSEDTFRAFYSKGDNGGGLVERPKQLGFVGIHTGFGSSDRRLALRETWFPSDPDGLLRFCVGIANGNQWWVLLACDCLFFVDLNLIKLLFKLEQATGIAFRFVIGRSKNAKKMAELHKEMEKYKDFMVIDVEEDNLNLPYKSLTFFKAAFELFEADYYVKIDDVIYLRPDRLAILLAKERTHPLTYIGCMKKGPVITDPKMKWYEKSGHLIGNEYFLHAYGPIYVLSAEVVASLAAARNNRCTNIYVVTSKLKSLCNPTKRLKELHKIGMCSRSPTLPPDVDDR
ncbi:putative beta-1 [Quercus suber]|uniref:Hexosyltransferase n=1 Tax=Quercus suber TaxID=58331 RepID=A0AAW0JWV7_QUESU